MPHTIGPKRLKQLFDAGVDPRTLALQQQFECARTMAHLLSDPSRCTPKRDRPVCGARCRDGHRCQARAVWDEDQDCAVNGRCRNHGGFSSGPKTQAGKQRIAAAARQRAQARRLAQAEAVERAAALAAYQDALATSEAVRQRDMAGFPGLKDALMEIQGREVEQRYQACLACGALAPDRRAPLARPSNGT